MSVPNRLPHGKRASCFRAIAKAFAELAELEDQQDEPALFGSRKPYPPPPEKSYRWLRDHGQELVDLGIAERRGGRRGPSVVYLVKPEAWRRYLETKRAKTVARPSTGNIVDIDAWIGDAGYRASKVGR